MRERDPRGAYSPKRRLSEAELATWRAFVRSHAAVTRVLEHDLERAGGLTLSELDVLLTLQGAEDGTLRMNDLAARVLLTKSGITRLVDRLESTGLIERRVCASDRRGYNAVLTARGRAAIRRTIGTHLRGVASAFADHIQERERPVVRRVLERITARSLGG